MNEEALALLRSIDASLKALVAAANRRAAANGPAVADDRDLDSQYGDEELRFTPRDWTGEPCKGRRMSDCPAELLEIMAASFDFFAKKNNEKGLKDDKGRPKSFYDKRSAARARGWAARKRNGWKRPEPSKSRSFDDADSLSSTKGDAFEDDSADFDSSEDF